MLCLCQPVGFKSTEAFPKLLNTLNLYRTLLKSRLFRVAFAPGSPPTVAIGYDSFSVATALRLRRARAGTRFGVSPLWHCEVTRAKRHVLNSHDAAGSSGCGP